MKKINLKAKMAGIEGVLCPCSSDPDSIDAVIFEEIKTVILDGTSPHIVEPKFAGACENIVNLGDCWKKEALYKNREKIIEATIKNKLYHKSASRYLAAAGQIFKDNIKLCEGLVDKKSVEGFAKRLSNKILPDKKAFIGKEWVRFIEGITPKGVISFSESVDDYKAKIILKDEYFVVAPMIIDIIRANALAKGYEIITLKNPFAPKMITDHILIPELSLAILTENGNIEFKTEERRIHARRFLDVAAVNRVRKKRRFNKRAFDELITTASGILAQAKAVHDELEGYYISAMNYSKNERKLEELWADIINR